ncbi:Monocarboxylate transporter 10 [Orchesella cincta]|uniref:Monocarboxylate transporter 10 n=1 Tax=Orchesella cincta TaxID=48709 RepID=A0A1D2NIS9_ORCCI|nr:Monocarboxylate transporter 10 [Orchesella cincta]
MANQYQNPRASSYIPTDDIPTVHYRRSSRRFSEIKESNNEEHKSSQNLLESLRQIAQKEEENADEPDFIIKEEYYSPEGPWGWLIVFAAFWTNFIVDGISLCYGVMTENLTEQTNQTSDDYGSNSTTVTSSAGSGTITLTQYNTVGSVLLGVTLMTGPFASIIAEKFGFRKTAIMGSVLATTGILSSWAFSPYEPNFWAFLFGFGILTGLGFGIMFTLSIVIVGLYFKKNREFATGITVAGTGVGTLTMGPVINEILKAYSWQHAILFQAGLAFISILCALVYKPVRKSHDAESQNMPVVQQLKELLTSPSYLVVSFAGSLIMMGYFAPFGFLVDSAADVLGKDRKDDAVFLLTILGIANACGRVFFGILANKIGHALLISNMALTVGGLVTSLYPFAQTHVGLILCAITFGLYSAVFASMRSIVIINIIGEKKFNVGFGLSLIFMGVATFFSNSSAGFLKEKTGNYDMSFYVAGGFLMLSAFICYPLSCIIKCEESKKEKVSASEDINNLSSPRKSLFDVQVKK